MLSYHNNSDTVVLVLHEIYGINQHIEDFCEELSRFNIDVMAPSLLKIKQVFNYEQENLAYSNFFDNVGFASACEQVNIILHSMRDRYKRIILIGLSIGATVAWLCSQEAGLCDAVIGLYGSRIRDYPNINPNCPVLLIFPVQEISFNVHDLVEFLNSKENVLALQTQGEHGFTNPASTNYNQHATQQAWQEISYFINKG